MTSKETGWTVDGPGFNVIEVHANGMATVAKLQPHARIKERARLMAAAPELLDALETMMEECPPSNERPVLWNNLSAREQARAAIAKAKGEGL